MKTLTCQRLDPSHLTACMTLRQNNPRDIDGYPLQSPMYARNTLDNQYLVPGNDFYRAYGMTDDDGRLWCYGLQKLLTSQRAWVLVLVISDQTEANGEVMNGLGRVLDMMIDYAESLRYYRYYTVTPAVRGDTHDKVWSRVSKNKADRYLVVPEEVVPERAMSAFSHYWDEVLGTMMFDESALLRHNILLPQYRRS